MATHDLFTVPQAQHARSSHVVQFYESDEFLDDVVASFLGAGLGAGQRVIAIATPKHLDNVCTRMTGRLLDLERARASGRLLLIDAAETLARVLIDDMPDEARFEAVIGSLLDAAGNPSTPVRAYNEMAELLWQSGRQEAALYLEQLWNDCAERRCFTLLCTYRFDHFDTDIEGDRFRAICRAHSHVIPTEHYSTLSNDEARLREVTHLQQRAAALGCEIERRGALEDELTRTLMRERTARTEAEAAGRAKDEFLAMLGHELRNPLAPIVTAVELARLRGWEGRELAVLERQSAHMVRLIDDLLDISRITRGKIELRRERLDIGGVIAKAIEAASPMLERRGQVLCVDVAEDCTVVGDSSRLVQVLANLLTNASKYSDRGTTVQICAGMVAGTVKICVRDQGIGIEPHMLDRIFESFVQQAQGMDRAQGGLGLGLAIARSLVELHGGSVLARSEGAGRGSEFEIELPAAEEEAPERSTYPVTLPPEPDSSSLRILVVDDNEDAASMLAEALGVLGHDVRVASDGPSALRVASTHHPELAFVDLGLPAMDGYELASLLTSAPWALDSQLSLIAISGYGQDADKERTRASGFLSHLVKPVDLMGITLSIEERRAQLADGRDTDGTALQ